MTTQGGLVIVTGIDGTGKSTVLKHLLSLEPDLVTASWRDFLAGPAIREHWGLRLERHPAESLATARGRTRSLFLAALVGLFVDTTVLPALQSGRWIVVESYVDVFLAKEKLFNAGDAGFPEWVDHLPKPEMTFFIDSEIELCCRRKKDFTAYDTYPTASPLREPGQISSELLRFQEDLGTELRRLAEDRRHLILDGRRSPEASARRIARALDELRGTG